VQSYWCLKQVVRIVTTGLKRARVTYCLEWRNGWFWCETRWVGWLFCNVRGNFCFPTMVCSVFLNTKSGKSRPAGWRWELFPSFIFIPTHSCELLVYFLWHVDFNFYSRVSSCKRKQVFPHATLASAVTHNTVKGQVTWNKAVLYCYSFQVCFVKANLINRVFLQAYVRRFWLFWFWL
jgi:hypothetical protein